MGVSRNSGNGPAGLALRAWGHVDNTGALVKSFNCTMVAGKPTFTVATATADYIVKMTITGATGDTSWWYLASFRSTADFNPGIKKGIAGGTPMAYDFEVWE